MNFIEKDNNGNCDGKGVLREKISNFFESEKFKSFILEVDESKREVVVGLFIELKLICPDITNDKLIEEFNLFDTNGHLKHAKNIEDFSLLITLLIGRQLKLYDINSIDSKNKIFNYFIDKYYKKGYFYHGFNGVFEDSIIKNGLSGDVRLWDDSDIDEVIEIIDNYRYNVMDFFSRLSINCRGSIFYTAKWFRETYYYSVASPEWFAKFVSGLNNSSFKGRSFNTRNYSLSRKNVIELCDNKDKITDDEKIIILNLFEKYWKVLAGSNSTPKIALIKKTLFSKDSPYIDFNDYCRRRSKNPVTVNIENVIKFMIDRDGDINGRYEGVIDKKDFHIIDLPDFNIIFPPKQKIESETKELLLDNFDSKEEKKEKIEQNTDELFERIEVNKEMSEEDIFKWVKIIDD